MAAEYIIKWRHGHEPEYRWSIVSIRQDGSFRGEIRKTYASGGKQMTVKGRLPSGDVAQVMSLAEEVEASGEVPPDRAWTGLLAKWPYDDPSILLTYAPGDEGNSSAAANFLRLIQVLKPHMEAFYSELGH